MLAAGFGELRASSTDRRPVALQVEGRGRRWDHVGKGAALPIEARLLAGWLGHLG
jgi:hypothetical protein